MFESSAADRELDGPVGILVQKHEVEIRRFVLEQAK